MGRSGKRRGTYAGPSPEDARWSERGDGSREILAECGVTVNTPCYFKTAAPSIVARDLRARFDFSCIS